MSRTKALICGVWLLLCGGCPPEEPSTCDPEFVGTEGEPVELSIVHRSVTGELIEAEEGGDVQLFRPPQGGKVFLTAARVRNVEKCGLRLRAALIDNDSGRVLGLEGRPYPVKTVDGWFEPLSATSLSSWANVPACPSRAASKQVDGNSYTLNVHVEDTNGNVGETEMQVVPRCVQPGFLGEQCRCECRADYTLGDRCEEDGGVLDGGGQDAAQDAAQPDAAQSLDAGAHALDASAVEDAAGGNG